MRRTIETCFIIVLGTALAFFVTIQRNNTTNRSFFSSAAVPVAVTPEPTSTPPGPVTSIMDSPEGGKTLVLEKMGNSYTLTSSMKPVGEKKTLYKTDEPLSSSFEIPFNTWSSDTTYVFLTEKNPSITNYFVFQSNGNVFANAAPYVSVQDQFKAKVTGYTIEDVTGWAGPTSLIVNTKAIDGNDKVSFWFDAPSQTFTRLNTYFK